MTDERHPDYYETLPGKLSLRLNDPDLGLSDWDDKEFIAPIITLMAEVDRLKLIVANQAIKIKAYEKERDDYNARK